MTSGLEERLSYRSSFAARGLIQSQHTLSRPKSRTAIPSAGSPGPTKPDAGMRHRAALWSCSAFTRIIRRIIHATFGAAAELGSTRRSALHTHSGCGPSRNPSAGPSARAARSDSGEAFAVAGAVPGREVNLPAFRWTRSFLLEGRTRSVGRAGKDEPIDCRRNSVLRGQRRDHGRDGGAPRPSGTLFRQCHRSITMQSYTQYYTV